MNVTDTTIECISGELYFSSPLQCALNPLASFVFSAINKAYSCSRIIKAASEMFQQIEGAPVSMEDVVDLIQTRLRLHRFLHEGAAACHFYRFRTSVPPSKCLKNYVELFPLVYSTAHVPTSDGEPLHPPQDMRPAGEGETSSCMGCEPTSFETSRWQFDPIKLEEFLLAESAGNAGLNILPVTEGRRNAGHDRYLLFRLHEGGLNNQLMSLEIAVGQAHATGRKLVLYGTGGGDRKIQECGGNFTGFPKIVQDLLAPCPASPSLLELITPLPVETLSYSEFRRLHIRSRLNIRHMQQGIADSVFVGEKGASDQGDLRDFADGRAVIHDSEEEVIHINRMTLGYYSRYFYKPAASMGETINDIQFLSEYKELAKVILDELGEFDGMHVRLTDFRVFRPDTLETFESDMCRCVDEMFGSSDCLVISTDESRNRDFFKSLRTSKRKIVFLDDFIALAFKERFRKLPMAGKIGFGLLCNLIMQSSRQFAGTPASTYTGMIQRSICMRRKSASLPFQSHEDNTFRFINSGFKFTLEGFQNFQYNDVKEGRYSWNRINLPIATQVKSWFREWPECDNSSSKIKIKSYSS